MTANIDNKTRVAIYKRENYACALCDSTRNIQVHHIIKRSLGGKNNLGNLICLCGVCHMIAHGTTLIGDDMPTQADAELGIIEYISDWYAENEGIAWTPKAD